MEKIDDLEYLYATARIRAMERNLLNRERLLRMCEAKNLEDVAKVLIECGWEDVNLETPDEVEHTLSGERKRTFRAALAMAPEKGLIVAFMLKYDYHNIKTIIKGEASGTPYEEFLMDCGKFPVASLTAMLRESQYASMSPIMRRATEEAHDVLNRTGDPQFSDIALDRGCLEEMGSLAKAAESDFLRGYVSLLVDSINLRTAVRLKRVGRPYDFMKQAYLKGGFVAQSRLLAEPTSDLLESVYSSTPLKDAATTGDAVLRGERGLAALDAVCENVLTRYLRSAKYVGLGEQPLIGYVAAKEAELTAVRFLMSGRSVGLFGEQLMERLRETYA